MFLSEFVWRVDVLTSALVTTSGTCRVSKLLLERLHTRAAVCAGLRWYRTVGGGTVLLENAAA